MTWIRCVNHYFTNSIYCRRPSTSGSAGAKELSETDIKKPDHLHGRVFYTNGNELYFRHVDGLGALLTFGGFELYGIAFVQSLETVALDVVEMHEQVVAGFALDKSKTLRFIKPLYGTLFHWIEPFCKSSSFSYNAYECNLKQKQRKDAVLNRSSLIRFVNHE